MQMFIKHELLSKMILKKNHKCEIYVESKFTNLIFKQLKEVVNL